MSVGKVGAGGGGVQALPAETLVAESSRPEHAEHTEAASSGEPSTFQKVMTGVGNELNHGEAVMRSVMHSGGADMSMGDILVLQANVYQYTQTVDLASHLVEQGTNATKTVVQGGGS